MILVGHQTLMIFLLRYTKGHNFIVISSKGGKSPNNFKCTFKFNKVTNSDSLHVAFVYNMFIFISHFFEEKM